MTHKGEFLPKELLALLPSEFRICGTYDPLTDRFTYLEEDCSYRTKYSETSNVIILLHPYEDQVTGVEIQGFRDVAKLALTRACFDTMPALLRWQLKVCLRLSDLKKIWRFRWNEWRYRLSAKTA